MSKVYSLLEFAALIPAIERDLQASGPMIVKRAAEIIEKRAKARIGKGHADWPPLAESTIADKAAHGFPTPKPLLRTGEFRDSIQHVAQGTEACVGTDDPRGPWFEFGTAHMPPRPVLVPAAQESEGRIHRMAAAATVAALSGHGQGARDVRELLHALRHVGHAAREIWDDLTEDDKDEP